MLRSFYLSLVAFAFLISMTVSSYAGESDPTSFLSLCYHNVEDREPDQLYDGVTTTKLIEQISWLQDQGYRFISVDDLLAARQGLRPLPPKAVLLTFDDGYESFYRRVYPILRAFHVPAVLALVDAWMKGMPGLHAGAGDKVLYGDVMMPRNFFLTWSQVREMEKSGLIEIASHSDALHRGITSNPQGNSGPAIVTATFDPKTRTYETSEAYRARLDRDAAASVKKIKAETGHAPRVMVWPYGAYNQISIDVDRKHGMPITLSLDDGFGSVKALQAVPRYLVTDDPSIGDFAVEMRQLAKEPAVRVIQVDLDYVYDPDPDQLSHNIDALISRVYKMQISTVFLQAFADPKGTGLASELYFPNRYLPMRADIFNRVARQLASRAHVNVYGWLPVLSFDLPKLTPVLRWNAETGTIEQDPKAYKRLSPFDPKAEAAILDIYEDMARHAPISGILFHDDAQLSDFEDVSEPALKAYGEAGLPTSIQALRADPSVMKRWTDFKTDALISLTHKIANRVELYRSPLKTARNIYAPAVLTPESSAWFAQDYHRFLNNYSYTAIMAMPEMENIEPGAARQWLNDLVMKAKAEPNGLKKTIFELQAVDWRKTADGQDRAIPVAELADEMHFFAVQGSMNFGYYPDDFVTNTPDADRLHKEFSLQAYPYLP